MWRKTWRANRLWSLDLSLEAEQRYVIDVS